MITLETDRLILRPFTRDDVDPMHEIYSDPVVMEFFPATRTREETVAWIERNLASYDTHQTGHLAAILKETGEFIGQVGILIQHVDGVNEYEIGYMFARRSWKNGYATEGAIACREYGFGELGRERLISIIHRENFPSMAVAERVGMMREKETTWKDLRVVVFSMACPTGD